MDIILRDRLWIDALEVGPGLDYVRKWPPEDWELAFFGSVHIIPQKDFTFIEEEMRRVISRRKLKANSRSHRGSRKRRIRQPTRVQRSGSKEQSSEAREKTPVPVSAESAGADTSSTPGAEL